MAASGGSRSAAEAVQAPPAMASQAQATTAAPKQHPAPGNIDSRRVGNQFVQQYYVVLRKSPSHLFRFFKEDSIFSHQSLVKGDHEHEVVPARDEAVLQERINYLYPGEENVEIKVLNVESQPSSNGGVIVQVTGTLQLLRPDSGPRLFAQTFFLATQPHGYFVLNDILRCVKLPRVEPHHAFVFLPAAATLHPSCYGTAYLSNCGYSVSPWHVFLLCRECSRLIDCPVGTWSLCRSPSIL